MNANITVVVPYHNEKRTISYTLEQIGNQTLAPSEAILVNSSSTDDTFEFVGNWIKENQPRFKTIFKNIFENTDNPASSKNVGILHAKTEWVAFMDCGQNFETTWLESQYNFALKNNFEVVSGVVYLIGENWVDRAAVAQTYGYKRNRPCVPTTLVKKSIFEKTGLFLEGRRAGYDAAWPIKLRKLGISRGVNEEVVIKYIGINFSGNLKHLFKKSALYAKPTVGIEGYNTPYYYLALLALFLGSLFICLYFSITLFLLYFLTRGYLLPIIKSNNLRLFKEHPLDAIFGLGIVGLVIDLGKLLGILTGVWHYHIKGHR